MRLLALSALLLLSLAMPPSKHAPRTPDAEPAGFDLQGHRGARGARPENTWPAFRHALRVGAVTLELDVAITADRRLVVSHAPWMNPQLCRRPSGAAIPPGEGKRYRLFDMTYAEIARFNCGSLKHPDFPEQQPVAAPKPLLADVLREADALAAAMGRPLPFYNIETKTRPAWDGAFHPPPQAFVDRLVEVVEEAAVAQRTVIQSFDARTLRVARAADFGGRLSLLVGRNAEGNLSKHVEALGFTPDVYSPDYRRVDESLIAAAAERGLAVVPWTVNDPDEMRRLKALGVDGLITDYPRRGRFLLE